MVNPYDLPKDKAGEDAGWMARVQQNILIQRKWLGVDLGNELLSFDLDGHVHEYQFFLRGLEGPA